MRPNAQRAGRKRRQLGTDQVGHALPLGRDLEVPPSSRRARSARRFGRREPQRVLAEDDGVGRGAAACGRVAGRGRHPARELRVRQLGRERQVEHAELVIRGRLRERHVELAPLARTRPLHRGRGNQWMRGADAVAVDDDHAGIDGVVERLRPRDGGELREPWVGRQRDGEQEPTDRRREPRDPRAEELLHRVGQRQVVAVSSGAPSASVRPTSSANSGFPSVVSAIRRTSFRGRSRPRRSARTRREGAHAQRLDLQPRTRRPERRVERRLALRACREKEAHGDAVEPPRRVGERVGGRAVEPLDVVDRDEEGLSGGERAERAQEADRDRRALGRRSRRRRPKQRDLERVQLRGREAAELGRGDTVEQVDQRRERVLRLGVGGSRCEDAKTALARFVDARLPERRLADARAADEHERVGDPAAWASSSTAASSPSLPTTPRPSGSTCATLSPQPL